MYISADVADRIKELAKEKNIPIKQLLENAELGFNTMANMKTSMPKADNLAKIADRLGCSVDYLLGRTNIKKIPTESSRDDRADMEREFAELFALLTPEQKAEIIAFLSLSPEQRKAALTLAGNNGTDGKKK